MHWNFAAAVAAALMMAIAAPVAHADSISSVENARIKERSGQHLSRQDRDNLRRYGGSDDYGYYGSGEYGYYAGPPYGGVSVYVGQRDHGYYGPYGY